MRKAKKRFTVDKKVRSSRRWLVLAAILLLLGAGAFFLLRDNDDPKKSQSSTTQDSDTSKSAESKTDENTTPPTPGNNDDTDPKDQTDNNTSTGGAPVAPYGNFVSNHRPELESSWELNRMQSVCNTTAGATCQISFTKDGTKKSLPAQKADKEGAVYWSWTLQDIGLTEGTWKITATATQNSQSASADDPISLEVKP